MLRDADAGAGREQRRRRRDVERRDGAAPGSAGVDQRVGIWIVEDHHGVSHRLGDGGNFVGGLALHAKADEERRDLHGGRLASHDEVEGSRQLGRRESIPRRPVA